MMDEAPEPSAYRISSAHEHNGKLFLGNLVTDFVSYVDLKALPPLTHEFQPNNTMRWSEHGVKAWKKQWISTTFPGAVVGVARSE
jgi:hypothetical protein